VGKPDRLVHAIVIYGLPSDFAVLVSDPRLGAHLGKMPRSRNGFWPVHHKCGRTARRVNLRWKKMFRDRISARDGATNQHLVTMITARSQARQHAQK